MAIIHTFNKINEDGSKTELTLAARSALVNTWLAGLTAEEQVAFHAAHARKIAMTAGQDETLAARPAVDPEWYAFWERFKSEMGVEQIDTDEYQ
jgi:hypothetical protein